MGKVTAFHDQLAAAINAGGGLFNAHLHLDRAGTLDDAYLQSSGHRILPNSHISLQKKHSLINSLHAGPAYEKMDLCERVHEAIDLMVACRTTRADSLVDVTADRVKLSALETMLEIKRQRADEIDLRIGAYSPLGFLDSEPERWEVFEQGAQQADFIAALPEADELSDYPGHIGFEEHCSRMLQLASRLNCMIHVHTDQRNHPAEAGTERLIAVVKELGIQPDRTAEPKIWAVHMVSPSTYDEERFQRLAENMARHHVGLICCPSAAVGMRQLRPVLTPTSNCIPRVLELLVAGVQVRLASDNIADICSPSTTPDLTDEVFVLSAALRFYNINILARLACGRKLSEEETEFIREHLEQNAQEIGKAIL